VEASTPEARLIVGVRILEREAAVLLRFKADAAATLRSLTRCEQRRGHVLRKRKRVLVELKRVQASKEDVSKQAQRLQE